MSVRSSGRDGQRGAPPLVANRRGTSAAWWVTALPLAALLALAHPTAQPYWSNQNQYFAHAVGDRQPALAQDWLVGTVDPYPLFTGMAGQALDLAGIPGLRAWSLALTAAGILAVGYVARQLSSSTSLWPSLVAMSVAGLTLSPFVSEGVVPSAFQGLAGQYLLSAPGYVQPASAGVALLFSVGLFLQHGDRQGGRVWRGTAAVAATAGIACAVHPTYAVVVGVAVAAAAAVDLSLRTTSRLRTYALVAATSLAVALVANPALLDLGASAAGDDSSLGRFAFERIPHHTLVTEWAWDEDWLVVVVIAAGSMAARRVRHGAWTARWLAVCLAGSLAAAVLVWGTRWASVALLFPWRISVMLMPVALAAVCVLAAEVVQRTLADRAAAQRSAVGAAVALVIGLAALSLVPSGVAATREASRPAESAAVEVVARAQPAGVGLIPLNAETVRLNAGYPVFVDWKSPPYASTDLDEWWRRVDLVRGVQAEPGRLCSAQWRQRVDWLLVPRSADLPDCLRAWSVTRGGDGWRVLVEP